MVVNASTDPIKHTSAMLKNATMAEIIDAVVADAVVDVYCSSGICPNSGEDRDFRSPPLCHL